MESQEILNLEFESQDLNRIVTIREYFFQIMKEFWLEQENFSPKRPLGNSDWTIDLVQCLIENGLVKGKKDRYDQWDFNWKEVDKFVVDKIFKPLFGVRNEKG
jgi:hypothetical protein